MAPVVVIQTVMGMSAGRMFRDHPARNLLRQPGVVPRVITSMVVTAMITQIVIIRLQIRVGITDIAVVISKTLCL